LAALSVRYFNRATPPEIRVEVSTPSTDDPTSFAISPDGRSLVFLASHESKSQLWLRPLDSVAAQLLPGTDGASYPFWSPDSASVGFFADGKLKRIDIAGGAPQVLTNVTAGRGVRGIPRELSYSLPILDLFSKCLRAAANGWPSHDSKPDR